MTRPRFSKSWTYLWAGALGLALATAPMLGSVPAPPAEAASRVSVTSSLGSARASASGPTTVKVSGSGFQSITKAMGGIYVVFGHAPQGGTWRPSKGGTSGRDFFYIADSQSKANSGYQRFVAFPGSSTADSANGGTLSASGSFSLSMVIPGPTFSAQTASGASKSIDCREVQCGIYTFGAHGISNANNETYTPVSFTASGIKSSGAENTARKQPNTNGSNAAVPAPQPNASGTPTQEAGNASEENPTPPAAESDPAEAGAPRAVASGTPTLGIDQKTVVAGRVLGFTGQGFAPGEQVVATVASGIAGAGPVTAGTFGELAGVVQIPGDMVPGTHKIKLLGAGTGAVAEAEFSVMANPASIPVEQSSSSNGTWWALVAVIVAGGILLLLVLSSLVAAIIRRGGKAGSKAKPVRRRKNRRPAGKRPAPRVLNNIPPAAPPARDPEPATDSFDQLFVDATGERS